MTQMASGWLSVPFHFRRSYRESEQSDSALLFLACMLRKYVEPDPEVRHSIDST
jgi:hypothetical protein